MAKVAESVLEAVEKRHSAGIPSAELLAFFATNEIRFGEATLRKWVQLGLLPRSVRVGKKGKHQGSKGKYPVRVIRQILRVKELMEKNLTIEEIQREVLFVRSELEELEQSLDKVFGVLDKTIVGRARVLGDGRVAKADLVRARHAADDLVARLEKIEQRLTLDPARVREDEHEAAVS
ncbi:MAG: hypothetical protein EXR75_09935 [Myxococcales bacterium]|nr:hypothetical protein [Myxococcales bacterium]